MIPVRTSTQGLSSRRRSVDQVKADGWHEVGTLAIDIQDPRLDDFDRQFLENLGEKLYGKRNSTDD